MATKSRTSVLSSSKKGRGDKKDNMKDEEELPSVSAVDQLAWKILNDTETDKLMTLSPRELSNELAGILKLQNFEIDLKEASQVDFYVTVIWFARENDLTSEQCSAFFTIVHTLINNIQDHHLSITDNIKAMKSMMAGIGVSQLTSLQCFTVETANIVIQYIAENLLQHYSLYEYLFTEEQEQQDSVQETVYINLPPLLESLCPAPLEEAVTEEFYNQYISPPSPPTTKIINTSEEQEALEVIDSQEEQQQNSLAELAEHSINREEIQTVLNRITQDTVSNYKALVDKTLHARETEYAAKLDKIAKIAKTATK